LGKISITRFKGHFCKTKIRHSKTLEKNKSHSVEEGAGFFSFMQSTSTILLFGSSCHCLPGDFSAGTQST
jgi:hypothetical protein